MRDWDGKFRALVRKKEIILPAILLLALAVRLMGIASRPIWYDEAFAILFSGKGVAAMLSGTLTLDPSGAAADVHPLAYYQILVHWMKVFGTSLVSVRMLSVLLGVGTVILVYFLTRSLFSDRRLANIATLGVALAPFLVHYSQEIRMYALLAFFLSGATFAIWQALQSERPGWWILFSFCAVLAQYTQNMAALFLVPLVLTPVMLRRWKKAWMALLAGFGAIVLYLPWLLILPAQLTMIRNAYWVERPTIGSVLTTMLSFVTNVPVAPSWLALALVITLITIALAIYQTFLAFRYKLPHWRQGAWLFYLAFIPPALAFLFSQRLPIYLERAFLASGVMFWMWLAWAFFATRLPRLIQVPSIILLLVGIIFGLATHLTYAGFPYGPYNGLDASIQSRLQAGDVIIHSNKISLLPAIYFNPSMDQHFIQDPPGTGADTLAPATQKVLGVAESKSMESAAVGAKRIWFIVYQKSLDEASEAGLPEHPHLAWLKAHFHFDHLEKWGPLRLYLYTR